MTPKHTHTFASGTVHTAAGGAVFVEPEPKPTGARIRFFTRLGGVSEAPFDSLNISTKVGDAPENVEENLVRIRTAMGGNVSAWVKQIAGDEVVRVSEGGFAGEADALVTGEENLSLVVGMADCVPVALVGGSEVGMVHSGWRGTLSGISGKAARMVAEYGSVSNVVAYIGPCIRRCCYEVSEELAETFAEEFGGGVVSGRNLSLPDAILVDLRRAGVSEVYDLGMCTGCRPDLFFSHRMEKPVTGRNLAAISRVGA